MKSRLTITLSDQLLKKVDQMVDKKTIRNRSHAIEHLIQQSLSSDVKTAVILAGGEPKEPYSPLAVIGNKPLILHTLDLLKKHGVEIVHITINKQGEELTKLLKDGKQYGLEIKFHREIEPLGTAGALKKITSHLQNGPFYVFAGDVLTNINLNDLVTFHNEQEPLVTMAVKPRQAQKNYDNVFVQGHTVVDFQASQDHQVVGIVNAGVYIFEPAALEKIPEKKASMLENDVFPQLAKSKHLIAFPFQGVWFDISSDTNYQEAISRL